MKIGDKIWLFDENHRIYVDDEGNKQTAPIYRKKFVEHYIVGETRVSWIVSRSRYDSDKVPEWILKKGKKVKKVDNNRTFWTSEEDIDKKCWIVDNIYRISDKVGQCKDYDLLKQIDDLIK